MKLRTPLLLSTLTALLFSASLSAQTTPFALGADLSWTTEMEADGCKFYDTDGTQSEPFQIMKNLGMNTVRLRVWVNPENAYGSWCNTADVLVKARRAKALGMQTLIDFHYSDFFTDPGRQDKPSAWASYTREQIKTAVAQHTRDVLTALKNEGITPLYIQVGNESRQGMIWPEGKQNWGSTQSQDWKNYAELSNAGYNAAKEILPDAQVIVHLNNAYEDNLWWFQAFQQAGGKLDVIGLSHYPSYSNYSSDNSKAITDIKKLASNLKLPVMIVEYGFSSWNEEIAKTAITDFWSQLKDIKQCQGLLYWEPQCNGTWKPKYYTTLGWNAYDMGAFTTDSRPNAALQYFKEISITTPIQTLKAEASNTPSTFYTLSGIPTTAPKRGEVYIKEGKKHLAK